MAQRERILMTGSTGYLGTYLVDEFLQRPEVELSLLVRARDEAHAVERLWHAWQLLLSPERFREAIETRVHLVLGDLTTPGLGLSPASREWLTEHTDSVLHVAASLNRKSSKACFNTNLRGTLQVIELARAIRDKQGLRRFTDVSTVAVCGVRSHLCVPEDNMVDWSLSDFDPYARTKKFGEEMVETLLPDVSTLVVRPSTVLGDSRFPETTQFDMVRAFVWLAQLPALPLEHDWQMDIVPADFVAGAAAALHLKPTLGWSSYNLSAGKASPTYRDIGDALVRAECIRAMRFAPKLLPSFLRAVELGMSTPPSWGVDRLSSLLKVFMPYLYNNLTFSNARVEQELGLQPTPFPHYAAELFRFAQRGGFSFPHQPWSDGALPVASAPTRR